MVSEFTAVEEEPMPDTDAMSSFQRKNEEKLTYKTIVLRAIEKCRFEGSKQMTKGVEVLFKDPRSGQLVPKVLEDQRKVWCECVMQFKFLMINFLDEDAKKIISEAEINIDNAYEKFVEIYLTKESYMPHKVWSNQTKMFHPKSEISHHLIQNMEDYILKQYQTIYVELLLLYKRKNELSNRRVIGLFD